MAARSWRIRAALAGGALAALSDAVEAVGVLPPATRERTLTRGDVVAMVRYLPLGLDVGEPAVIESWARVLRGGLQLPWLTVLRPLRPEEQTG